MARPWRTVIAATLLTLVPHVALRSFNWRYEWTSTFITYSFSTIMLGPILAGIACGWASEFYRCSASLVISGTRRMSFVLSESIKLILPALGLWLMGLIGLCLTTLITTNPGIPHAADFLPIISSLTFLILCAVSGFSLGWNLHRMWCAPLVALGFFGAIIWLHGTSFSRLIDTGAAPVSLIGLSPSFSYYGLQIFTFLCLIPIIGKTSISPARYTKILGITLGTTIVIATGFTEVEKYNEINPDLVCQDSGAGRKYCVGKGYRHLLPKAVNNYEEAARAFDALDIPLPFHLLTQKNQSSENEGYLDIHAALEPHGFLNQTFIWPMRPSWCEISKINPEINVLIYATGSKDEYKDWLSHLPAEFRRASTEERRNLARLAYQGIVTCTPVFSR